jgi:hypothetical protein
MNWRRIGAAALAGMGLLVAGSARASDDLVPLKGDGDAVTMTLGSSGDDADTELLSRRGGGGFSRGFHGGFHGGFNRGFHGGFNRGFHGNFHRGFHGGFNRNFFWASYRPWWYGGFYRPYWNTAFYRPYWYGGFYPAYYSTPSVYPLYSSYAAYPCNGTDVGTTETLQAPSGGRPGSGFYTDPNYNPNANPSQPGAPPPMPPADPGAGFYPYDGGPQNLVPMPGGNGNANPISAPAKKPATVPLEGRLVSLPAQGGGQTQRLNYPAYGEGSTFAIDRLAAPAQVARKGNGR